MSLFQPTSPNLNIYCDGGARGNPGPAAIGFLVKDSFDHVLYRYSEFIGHATNNIAEYRAVIAALNWLVKNKQNFPFPTRLATRQVFHFQFFLDSTLVVNQLNGHFKVKNPQLKSLFVQATSLIAKLSSQPAFTTVPRSANFPADRLVNQALDRNT